jgi:hypothetical protein
VVGTVPGAGQGRLGLHHTGGELPDCASVSTCTIPCHRFLNRPRVSGGMRQLQHGLASVHPVAVCAAQIHPWLPGSSAHGWLMAHPCTTTEVMALLLSPSPLLPQDGDASEPPSIDEVPDPGPLASNVLAAAAKQGPAPAATGLQQLCAWFVAVAAPVLGLHLNPASVAAVMRRSV